VPFWSGFGWAGAAPTGWRMGGRTSRSFGRRVRCEGWACTPSATPVRPRCGAELRDAESVTPGWAVRFLADAIAARWLSAGDLARRNEGEDVVALRHQRVVLARTTR